MEEMISKLIENSLIGGAFIYMLHYFLGRFSTALDSVVKSLEIVSTTLIKMNERLDDIEERMDRIDKKGAV